MNKGISTILENHKNQERIRQLEALLPEQEKAFTEINRSSDVANIARVNLYIQQLKLEYKERVGRDYEG